MKKTSEKSIVFGQRLRRLRQRLDKSAAQVAKELGIAASTYRDWELGRAITGQPYVELAKVLDVSIQDLFEDQRVEVQDLKAKLTEIEGLVQDLRRMI